MSPVRVGLADWRLPVAGPDAVELAAEAGVDGIQFDLGGEGRGQRLNDPDRLAAISTRATAKSVAPLAVSVNALNDIGLNAAFDSHTGRQVQAEIQLALECAEALGAPLVFLPSFGRSLISSSTDFEQTASILSWASSQAKKKDLYLASENILGHERLSLLFQRVRSDNFRILFDGQNYVHAGIDYRRVLMSSGISTSEQVHLKSSNPEMPLESDSLSLVHQISTLGALGIFIDTIIIENDYRNGDLQRLEHDIDWLRNTISESSHRSFAPEANM